MAKMNIKKNIILSTVALSCLALASCGNDNDAFEEVNKMSFMSNLPDAENIKSTSAYVPVYDKGYFRIVYSTNKDQITSHGGGFFETSLIPDDSSGFLLRLLEPDATYYYTMAYLRNDMILYSNQVKSFTTKGVSIEFIEPETVPMGNWIRKIPRVKTTGIEDSDVPNLFVNFYFWSQSNPSSVGLSAVTSYAGGGIWKDDNSLKEGECFQAEVKVRNGRVVAKTPVMVWTNGAMEEVHE